MVESFKKKNAICALIICGFKFSSYHPVCLEMFRYCLSVFVYSQKIHCSVLCLNSVRPDKENEAARQTTDYCVCDRCCRCGIVCVLVQYVSLSRRWSDRWSVCVIVGSNKARNLFLWKPAFTARSHTRSNRAVDGKTLREAACRSAGRYILFA